MKSEDGVGRKGPPTWEQVGKGGTWTGRDEQGALWVAAPIQRDIIAPGITNLGKQGSWRAGLTGWIR